MTPCRTRNPRFAVAQDAGRGDPRLQRDVATVADDLCADLDQLLAQAGQRPFQTAEVAVPRQMFADILSLVAGLRAPPVPA